MSESTRTVKTTKNNKPSWTPAEEIQLCKSWIAISVDASAGTDQSSDTLWGRIHEHLLSSPKTNQQRTAHSLLQHWVKIQAATNNYMESVAKAVGFSGENSEDMHVRIATIHANQYGGPYKFLHCWDILNKCEKWKEYNSLAQEKKMAKKKKKEAITVPDGTEDEADREADGEDEGEGQEEKNGSRPGGRDAAKNAKKRKAIETAEERYAKRMSAYVEHDRNVLAELKRGNDIAQREQDMKIMAMDLSGLDDTSKAYFQELKARAAERLNE